MSRMGNKRICEAEALSLDNACEVAQLREEVARLAAEHGDLMEKNRRLRLENAQLIGTLEGLERGLREGGLLTPEHMREILSRFRDKP